MSLLRLAAPEDRREKNGGWSVSDDSGNRSDAGLPWKQVKKLGFPPTTVEIAVMLVYLGSK